MDITLHIFLVHSLYTIISSLRHQRRLNAIDLAFNRFQKVTNIIELEGLIRHITLYDLIKINMLHIVLIIKYHVQRLCRKCPDINLSAFF